MAQKLTTEQFIEKAKLVHGDRYDYSKVEYINSYTKITIICKEHGEFRQTHDNHVSGRGCKKCGIKLQKSNNIVKYGVSCSLHSKTSKEKTKKTMLDRYGVEFAFHSNEIMEKRKKTWLINYGVENPAQSKEIREKTKKTNNDKYGVNNPTQKHMLKILPLLENTEWLFEQYIILNKTTYEIADELNINDTTICNYLRKQEIDLRDYVGYSMVCIQWLESIMKQEQIFIQHAGNIGEYKIPGTRFKSDGYCKETNTIYEFHGDIFHGNPDLFEDDYMPNFYNNQLTAKQLYDKTIERENKIKELGFNLVVMWENDYNKLYSSL